MILPAGFANVHSAQVFRVLVKEQRVQRLLVGIRLGARLASRRAGLDVPLIHGRANLTMNGADEHEENNPRISRMSANFWNIIFLRVNSRNSRIKLNSRNRNPSSS
jgi:hypothetical protein